MSLVPHKSNRYYLLINKIKLDFDKSLIIQGLKNKNDNCFIFNKEENMWYYNNYKSKTKLIDLLFPDKKIISVEFKNRHYDDYRIKNIILTCDEKYEDKFLEPKYVVILYKGTSQLIKKGPCAGQYRNMYWKVKDNNLEYYSIHITDDIYTKVSIQDIEKVLNFNNKRPIWYTNGEYIRTTVKNDEGNNLTITLHQYVMDVHFEDLSDFTKTVDHINRDKYDNRRENLKFATMSEQNKNKNKQERRKDACPLPEGIVQTDLPIYVQYSKRNDPHEKDLITREYFVVEHHPKLNGEIISTTKSKKVSIEDKLVDAKLTIDLLNSDLVNSKADLEVEKFMLMYPLDQFNIKLKEQKIKCDKSRDKYHFNYDNYNKKDRKTLKYIFVSNNINDEYNKFMAKLKETYPEEKFELIDISDGIVINEDEVSQPKKESLKDKLGLVLPDGISFVEEKGKYRFMFSKFIDTIRYTSSHIIESNDLKKEYTKFYEKFKTKFPKLELDNTQNVFPKDVDLVKTNKIDIVVEPPLEKTITTQPKPSNTIIELKTDDKIDKCKLPTNFEIEYQGVTTFIKFIKIINDKKFIRRRAIYENDIIREFSRVFPEFEKEYNDHLISINLTPTGIEIKRPIINPHLFSLNKLSAEEIEEHKERQRDRTNKYLDKLKDEIGEEKFRKQKAEYAREYRSKN